MQQDIFERYQSFVIRRKRRNVLKKVVNALACIVIFCTTYALILPAITMEKEAFCGIEEHVHSEACYGLVSETTLVCTPETLNIHTHSTDCYDAEGALCCGQADYLIHAHNEGCYNAEGTLVCTIAERDTHVHGESCYAPVETQAPVLHAHSETCYTKNKVELVCTAEETEGHAHSDGCYVPGTDLICTIEEDHVHGDSCYSSVLGCGLDEIPAHAHNDECWSWENVIGCGMEEGQEEPTESIEPMLICAEPDAQVHVHDDGCFETTEPQVMPICGNTEEGHEHVAECYELVCGMEAHSHDLTCYSDPDADLEDAKTWEATFAHVNLTGNWNQDVLAIAETQLGYRESSRNYEVSENNTTRGYTRYGAWYGVPYGDWCAMFASFCIHYAEVEGMPLNSSVQAWIAKLTELELYSDAKNYDPKPGDLVFFDWDEDGRANHVGFVVEITGATQTKAARLKTIEGNSSDRVQYAYYDLNDPEILGYGKLPEKDGTDPVYYCGIEDHVHDESCLVERDLQTFALSANTYYCDVEDTEHVHTDVCTIENEADRKNVTLVIQKINEYINAINREKNQKGLQARAYYNALKEDLREYVTNSSVLDSVTGTANITSYTVRFDGTNGNLSSLSRAGKKTETYLSGWTIEIPDDITRPIRQDYVLRGWYMINGANKANTNTTLEPEDCYYPCGSAFTVEENSVFYADWIAASYDFGQPNEHVVNTVSTNDFITTKMFDYNSIFNMYSSQYTGNDAETWTALDTGMDLPGKGKATGLILRNWDSEGSTVLSWPSNYDNDSYKHFSYQVSITQGLLTKIPNTLSLLFNENNNDNPLGVTYIGEADHLFQYDTNTGYYFYNSGQNAASYNQTDQRFYVYDYLEQTTNAHDNTSEHDFLPFNSPYIRDEVKDKIKVYLDDGIYYYDNLDSMGASPYNDDREDFKYSGTNFWFGMKTEIQFYLPNNSGSHDNPTNISTHGQQMIFEFSGDDDVWVFVDDTLVLDIGGIHKARKGTINFSTGEVTLEKDEKWASNINNPDYYYRDTLQFEAGEHKLTMYYMERGSSLSNCSIKFNISPRYGLTLKKEDQNKQILTGTEFKVFMDANCTTPATLWPSYDVYLQDRDNTEYQLTTNILNVADGTASIWGFAAGNTYYIKETVPPDGEGYILPNGLIEMVLDNSGDAEYRAVVIEDPNPSNATQANPTNGFIVSKFDVNELEHTISMTVTNSYPSTDISVEKVWAEGSPENLPAITVDLLADGTVVKSVELKEGSWKYTWENLPKLKTTRTTNQDGSIVVISKEIQYTVKERAITGFTSSIVETTKENIPHFVITNTPVAEVDVKVVKQWLKRDGTTAADSSLYKDLSITVKLLANDEAVEGKSVVLNADNSWTHTFEKLPEKDENGDTIVYRVQEVVDDSLKDWTTASAVYDETAGAWVIKNVYSRVLEIPVQKIWNDPSVAQEITVQLYAVSNAEGENQVAQKVGESIKLNAASEWKNQFTNVVPPEELGVTYYVYELTDSFAVVYDTPENIFVQAEGGDSAPKQIAVGKVSFGESGTASTVTITNYAMQELPNTGGPGTIHYTAGGLLMTAAALFLTYITKKKSRREDA